MLDARTDEPQAGLRTVARERGAFAQEAVARVDRIAAGLECRGDDRSAVQICARPGARQLDGVFRLANVQRLGVVLRIDRDGPRTELGGGTRDADGDLAAIGNQQIHPFTSSARSVRAAMK